MSELKDGLPTGRLNANATMAEVSCYTEEAGPDQILRQVPCGTRWIPVTDEMRRKMQGCIVSMVDITPELAERLYAGDPSQPQVLPVKVRSIEVGDGWGKQEGDAKEVVAVGGITFATMNVGPADIARVTSPSAGVPNSMAAVLSYDYSHVTADNLKPEESGTASTCEEDRRQHERREFKEENSGGNVNYYCVPIDKPKRPERAPYIFEVEDLIQALNMTFHEGTVLKSLVRSCVERELGMRKVGADYIRDAEKMVHSSAETLRIRRIRGEKGLK